MDREERLTTWLETQPDTAGASLEERVLRALSALERFGYAEVQVAAALGEAATAEWCRRLGVEIPPPEPVVYTFPKHRVPEDHLIAEIATLIETHPKFKTRLTALPGRLTDNDRAYGESLMEHYHSREAKEQLGVRPAALLATFVELWLDAETRDVAKVEYSLHLL